MPVDSMLVAASVVIMFVAFAQPRDGARQPLEIVRK